MARDPTSRTVVEGIQTPGLKGAIATRSLQSAGSSVTMTRERWSVVRGVSFMAAGLALAARPASCGPSAMLLILTGMLGGARIPG
jgi:hypothetical protein